MHVNVFDLFRMLDFKNIKQMAEKAVTDYDTP